MSKGKARGEQSYSNERLVLAQVPGLLEMQGFKAVRVTRKGPMKFIDAETAARKSVRFWLKQGWTDAQG